MSRNTALLNGAILWASMLALSAWLLSSGVSGAFGVAASNAGSVMLQAQSARLKARLSEVDRETLVKLMTQQGNLTEEQVDRDPAQSRSNRTKQP
jgi:hypothetical protein